MNNSSTQPTVVLISANVEWKVVRAYFHEEKPSGTPFGECLERNIDGRQVIFMHGGWGKISAAASAQYAISRWCPALLMNLGTCGGLAGQVEKGELLLVTHTLVYDIIERMTDAAQAVEHYGSTIDLSWLCEPLPQTVRRARLLSADQDLDPLMIPLLRDRYEAIAVDWESGAIAWVAQKNRVRCLILRGVSDIVHESGGEAYLGDIGVFTEGTLRAMTPMLEALPAWLQCAFGKG